MYPLIQDVCKDLLQHLREDKGEGKKYELIIVQKNAKESRCFSFLRRVISDGQIRTLVSDDEIFNEHDILLCYSLLLLNGWKLWPERILSYMFSRLLSILTVIKEAQ